MLAKILLFCLIPVSVHSYTVNELTGLIDPSRHSGFVRLNGKYAFTDSKNHYLRKEAAEALFEMSRAFEKYKSEYNSSGTKNITVKITVISSTRTFDTQAGIWNGKWKGKYSSTKDDFVRGIEILKYSSMPGTSRHHWGTDFDINSLNNGYFESGDGKILFDWLEKNALKFGFARPYTAGRNGGYMEEKWHWSYLPLSVRFLAEWNAHYTNKKDFYIMKNYSGGVLFTEKAFEYVNVINPRCYLK